MRWASHHVLPRLMVTKIYLKNQGYRLLLPWGEVVVAIGRSPRPDLPQREYCVRNEKQNVSDGEMAPIGRRLAVFRDRVSSAIHGRQSRARIGAPDDSCTPTAILPPSLLFSAADPSRVAAGRLLGAWG